MNLIVFFLMMIFATFFIGCAKPASSDVVTETKTSSSVGPFTLALSTETGSAAANAFSADIDQEDGAVDFYNPGTVGTQYLVLENYTASVRGCNATSVKVTPLWYANEASSSPAPLAKGYTFTSTPSTRGKLRVIFQGMKGCTHLDFNMTVRKLEIGQTSNSLEPRLAGSWDYGTAPGLTISLFIGSSRVGWLEGQGVNYTCDTQMYPQNSVETNGGWLVSGGGGLLCHYQFDSYDSSFMNFNCYGTNLYGCSVPKNFRFHRH